MTSSRQSSSRSCPVCNGHLGCRSKRQGERIQCYGLPDAKHGDTRGKYTCRRRKVDNLGCGATIWRAEKDRSQKRAQKPAGRPQAQDDLMAKIHARRAAEAAKEAEQKQQERATLKAEVDRLTGRAAPQPTPCDPMPKWQAEFLAKNPDFLPGLARDEADRQAALDAWEANRTPEELVNLHEMRECNRRWHADQAAAEEQLSKVIRETEAEIGRLECSKPAKARGCCEVPVFQTRVGEAKGRRRCPACHRIACDHCWTVRQIESLKHAMLILSRDVPAGGVSAVLNEVQPWRSGPVYRGVFDSDKNAWRSVRRQIKAEAKRLGIPNPGASRYLMPGGRCYIVSHVAFAGANETTPAIALGELVSVILDAPRYLARGKKDRVRLDVHIGRWKKAPRLREWKTYRPTVSLTEMAQVAHEMGIDCTEARRPLNDRVGSGMPVQAGDLDFDGTGVPKETWQAFVNRITTISDLDGFGDATFVIAGERVPVLAGSAGLDDGWTRSMTLLPARPDHDQ